MAVGFESYNDDGALQFSSQTNCFTFLQKGSFLYQSQPFISTQLGSVSGLQAYDYVVFACDTTHLFPVQVGSAASGNIVMGEIDTGADHTVYYWTFKSMKTLPPRANGAGLEIYDANGQISYTDQFTPLRVVRKLAFSSIPTGPSALNSLPAGKTYAFGAYGNCHVSGATPAIKRVGAGYTTSFNYPLIAFGPNALNGGLLVVDVTGY